jgi:hypothetical protein
MNMPPSPVDPARQRFLVLTLVRLSGVAMAILGMAVLAEKVDLPAIAGYVLVALGALETLVMPVVLIKAWKTPPQ